jgi:gliding motility-associated-like protein
MYRLLVVLFLVYCPVVGWATHIVGGDVSLVALDKTKPGYYRIQLTQYWETSALQSGNQDAVINLLVFRKRNPVLIETIQVDLRATTPLAYDNEACATQLNLRTTQALYYRDYQFDIAKYTEPDGYYIVWERCCRNSTAINLATPVGLGMAMYMEFPAMMRNGVPVINSSPTFALPNGAYICLNKPFTFDLGATDTDGDELRYSLVTPLQGYTTAQQIVADGLPKTSYPEVVWANGYSAQNAIPGTPPLQVDARTGLLSVRASRQGIFLFTVQVEEYRNGQRIGLIRRDFQLPVIDCTPRKPPVARIQYSGQPATTISICPAQTALLTVENDPSYAYQWQKDGLRLTGMTSYSLTAAQSGVYTVIRSYKTTCASDTVSEGVQVRRSDRPPVDLIAQKAPFCDGDTVTLQTTDPGGLQYSWRRDGQLLNAEQRSSLRTSRGGTYIVSVSAAGGGCTNADTLLVALSPRPDARLQASATAFCEGDSVILSASTEAGLRYQWLPVGIAGGSRLAVREGGMYRVQVTAATGCSALSGWVTLQQKARPAVQLDSVPPFCQPDGRPVTLRGTPTGGTYAGVGVGDDQFDPGKAGLGRHRVSYTVQSGEGCSAEAVRWIGVSGGLTLQLPPRYPLARGGRVRLEPTSSQPIVQASWSPPTGLDNPALESPWAAPDQTTTYRLQAVDVAGCPASGETIVEVVEQIYVPDAFSPNGDGVNDVWDIRNIAAFTDCEVIVYNRWGEVIFQSRGYATSWNGTYQQQVVEPGVYTYQIRLINPIPTLYKGYITVLK